MFIAHRQFRLARGPDHPGMRCDAGGVWLGGVQLLVKTEAGFAPRPTLEIDVLTKAGYGAAFDTERLTRGLAVAARALNDGDLGRAMVATLHLRLPELDAHGVDRLAAVDAALAKYSPDQPRDWHGRWTAEGGDAGGPGPAGEAERPSSHHGEARRADREALRPAHGRNVAPNAGDAAGQPPASSSRRTERSGDDLVSHPSGGRLIDTAWQGPGADADDGEPPGYGDNSGARPLPEGASGSEPPADPALPTPKTPPGWDQPGRVVNGVYHPPERVPMLSNGQPWPRVGPDSALRALRPDAGTNQTMKVYVPLDHIGPVLVGSNENGDFEQPSGYGVVYLRGVPQQTYSRGAETAHALKSAERSLEMAETNNFSDIYFNRTITVITSRGNQSSLRPDVAALYRPSLSDNGEFDVWEVFSPGQRGPERERSLRAVAPRMRGFGGEAYKLLLKLLRALGIS